MLQFNATFLVAMFSFVVFIMIMNKILYKPILKIVNEREGFINSNYADAKETTEKSENILKERDEKLVQTKTESRKIISGKVQTAHKEAKIQTEAVMKKSREEISRAKETMQGEEVQLQNALGGKISNLAETITEKLLGEHIPVDSSEIVNKV